MRANPAYERTRARPLATLRTLNDWITALAQKRSYVLADYYAPMLDARAQLAEDLADDGLHPNAKGYRLMAPIVLGAIDRAFPSVPAQPAARKKRLFN
jgi:lysophospholipase L1-like esterase